MMPPATPPSDAQDALSSPLIHVFAGLSFICIAVAFSYLDRRYGFFLAESMFWVLWGVTGFLAGALTLHRAPTTGKILSLVLTVVALGLAVFPAYFLYPLLRWVSVLLMLVIAARAPMMRTRRDLYLCLTVCFSVSFMVATHSTANWTLWLYLGPAWVCIGLALTWEYASSRAIGSWTKTGMSLGFIAICTLVAVLLFMFLPRPPVLGFGFIPPGADAPGLVNPAATDGENRGAGTAPGARPGQAPGQAFAPGRGNGGWLGRWQGMLEQMRPAIRDTTMPQWQRDLLGKLLDWAQRLAGTPSSTPAPQADTQQEQHASSWLAPLLLALLILVLARLLYRHRYWLGVELLQLCAGLLATRRPLLAMRLSARALVWCLTAAGHRARPGESLREYFLSAPGLPRLSRRWFGYALDVYCETRFGPSPATPLRATRMRQAVSAAAELVRGHAPELAQP